MGISYDPPSRKLNVVPESIPDTTPKQTSIWVDDNGGNLYAIDVSKDAYLVQQHNKMRARTKTPKSLCEEQNRLCDRKTRARLKIEPECLPRRQHGVNLLRVLPTYPTPMQKHQA